MCLFMLVRTARAVHSTLHMCACVRVHACVRMLEMWFVALLLEADPWLLVAVSVFSQAQTDDKCALYQQ